MYLCMYYIRAYVQLCTYVLMWLHKVLEVLTITFNIQSLYFMVAIRILFFACSEKVLPFYIYFSYAIEVPTFITYLE